MTNILKSINNFFSSFFKHDFNYHHSKTSYVSANIYHGRHSGWEKTQQPPRWVYNGLIHAPDYTPSQGMHYFPYCRGRHFEYFYDWTSFYRRKLKRHRHKMTGL